MNITLPPNTTFYIADITIPVTWYTIEAGRNNIIYYRVNVNSSYVAKCELYEGNYTTTSLALALTAVMNTNYPAVSRPAALSVCATAPPVLFSVTSDLPSNTIAIANGTDQFELLTDEQTLLLAYDGLVE